MRALHSAVPSRIASVLFFVVLLAPAAWPQDELIFPLQGQVFNSVTKAPIARVLVTAMGGQYATLTNDEGKFEFQIRVKTAPSEDAMSLRGLNAGVTLRKPGFLDRDTFAFSTRPTQQAPRDLRVYLVPEALIVGHVDVPGSEGEVRIECELYRREFNGGRETWTASGRFSTWANGEFRFSGLSAGTYKLVTHEEMDRDSMAQPGAQPYGYPPVYYPNTTDFSAASEIVVKAGETVQADLSVARRPYYPVRLSAGNVPPGQPLSLELWPMGHWGPGWSLGYNPSEHSIDGMLPEGNYTLEANALGPEQSSAMTNFAVKGRPLLGPGLVFVPNASISVTVHREFQNNQSSGEQASVAGSAAQANLQRLIGLQISLSPVGDAHSQQEFHARPVDRVTWQQYTVPNVRPGLYQVNVEFPYGYASVIESGGKDLLREPLTVGLSGGTAPIEITLRDDGAAVDGTIADPNSDPQNNSSALSADVQSQPQHWAYLLPLGPGQMRGAASSSNNTFQFEQIAPGDYLVVAFSEDQENLPYGNPEAMQSLQGKGQVLHLEAGQKTSVALQLIDGSGE